MWPLALIIGVAVAGSVVLLVTGVFLAISLERRRHRYIMQAHGLTRDLGTYHRTKLSANENNYSHVTAPRTYLRRSVQLPYGVVSIGCLDSGALADVDEEEQAGDHTAQQLHDNQGMLLSKGRRSIRRSFNGQPLQIPKTRRQRKLRKAMPSNQMQDSPLSVITEFTDSPPCTSPSAAESFSETGQAAPILGSSSRDKRQLSIQWPLIVTKTRSSDSTPTEVMSMAARASMLVRMGGAIVNTSDPPRQPIAPRSLSMASTNSAAPAEPLPPLPTIDVCKRQRTYDLKPKASNASLETVGSSVLGATVGSHPKVTTVPTTPQPDRTARFLGLGSHLDGKPSTPRLHVPPGKQAIHGLCASKPSIHSLHPSFDMNESPEPIRDYSSQHQFPTIVVREESFKTIDTSHWANPIPLKVNKTRSGGTHPARHSMYEASNVHQARSVSDSVATDNFHTTSKISPGSTNKRPASVATGNPLQWDGQRGFAFNRYSLSSLDGLRSGHKRQNCVRITNLPAIDPRPKSRAQMPELQEEQPIAHDTATYESNASVEPEPQAQDHHHFTMPKAAVEVMNTRSTSATPSPFRNRPSLTPSFRPVPQQYMQPSSSAYSGIPRADSNIFTAPQLGRCSSTSHRPSPVQWHLSPDLSNNIRSNGTPPSARPSESQPFDSPTLPSPALDSSSLYPRRSLVKGPRNPRTTGSGSSPSPLQNKQGPNFRVSKDRDSSNLRLPKDRVSSGWVSREKEQEREVDLRKSVMMLRSMNSEGRLIDQHQHNIRFYRNVGVDNSSPGPAYRLTPPMNKRISGLRQSSCASSTMSVNLSPVPDKNRDGNRDRNRERDRARSSRETSPLVQSTSMKHAARLGSSPSRFKQDGGVVPGAAATLAIPSQNYNSTTMSASPSGLSIWEDASVCGESPEPEFRTPQHGIDRDPALYVTPLVLRTKSNLHGRERDNDPEQHQQSQQARRGSQPHVRLTGQGYKDAPPSRPRTPNKVSRHLQLYSSSCSVSPRSQPSGPGKGTHGSSNDGDTDEPENDNGNDSDMENMPSLNSTSSHPVPNSRLVQRLERAASSGQWQHTTGSDDKNNSTSNGAQTLRTESSTSRHRNIDSIASIHDLVTTSARRAGTATTSTSRSIADRNHNTKYAGLKKGNSQAITQIHARMQSHDLFQPTGEVGLGLSLGNTLLPGAYY
ncbi:hypothetical protein A1O1_02267 [Capronia coronata CBS 617.96]|uniref:Uncharacterized protein n=1 Tax=Capronia coronata CBS 617.96 TaxID=1182541 RepID=W9ZHD5_9EURO|nr:uncharacterized protein A1O1_02267 [Capronia coronata CBS 617.96]EXJ93874.1 hypothetical protein A1O1_02267 [Capronia coronata CBS 617.96]